ncbi:MFS transporter [Ectothiorhodospiraceae bacterium 2226]|nr:MFS transporter [Ectothiorhodospiraceae bacterium 2226]
MPYWRLSSFYFFYFGSIGALVPYWGLYLKSIGFTPLEIGQLMALIMATKIVSPNVWGWIADHTGRRMTIVRVASLLGLLTFGGVFFGQTFWWMALVMLSFSFFWNASLPQFEATTLNHLGTQTHRYSAVRVWGSIGFILVVAVLGPILDRHGTGILPIALLVLFAGIWFASLVVPEHASRHLPLRQSPLKHVLQRPEVLGLLGVCFLMQASHGPYYTFYSIYLEDYGYARSLIGYLWGLGVLAEVVVFLMLYRLVHRFGLRRLLLAALALAALRWVVIGQFPHAFTLLLGAQLLHAASFGIYHAVAIAFIHRYFVGRHQGRGQALYSSLSFGAGGALGGLYSGYAWDGLGATTTFFIGAGLAALAFGLAWRYVGREDAETAPAKA